MANCVTLANLAPAANCVDIDNRGGIVNRILLGYADEVASWPDLPGAGDMETAGEWDGELALASSAKLVEIHFTDETGVLNITDQGEKGGESFLYDLTIVRAKMNKMVAGLENAVKGRGLVIIVEDRNGVLYLMGDEKAPAYKVAGDGTTTGTTGTDRNQTTLKFQYTCPRKLVYGGDIESLITKTT